MKSLPICALSLGLFSGSALADEVIVTPPVPAPGIVIEHHDSDDGDATHKKVVIDKDANGCTTKSVTKSNDQGDSVTHTKSNC